MYIRNLNICVIHTVDHVNLHRMFHRVQRLLVDVELELFAEDRVEARQRDFVADVDDGETCEHRLLTELHVLQVRHDPQLVVEAPRTAQT